MQKLFVSITHCIKFWVTKSMSRSFIDEDLHLKYNAMFKVLCLKKNEHKSTCSGSWLQLSNTVEKPSRARCRKKF